MKTLKEMRAEAQAAEDRGDPEAERLWETYLTARDVANRRAERQVDSATNKSPSWRD